MARTHCVALFLPHTIAWEARQDDSPPRQPMLTHIRHASAAELSHRNHSQTSLLGVPSPSRASESTGDDRLDATRTGTVRSHVRSDAQKFEWGREGLLNQPASQADPLPPVSILHFTPASDLPKQRRRLSRGAEEGATNQGASPPPQPTQPSQDDGRERQYESKSWEVVGAIQGNGGLTNAMRALGKDEPHDVSWIGTLGFPTDALSASVKADIANRLADDHQSGVVYLTDKDMEGHFTHFCKTVLWPIMHYQLPALPKSKAYADHSWEFYRNVNQAFADKVVSSYKRGETIWVHDYHLLLVPGMVRAQLPDAKIGFFLHTAFPSSEIFRCLSTRKQLLEGMLGANLVAFQIKEYAEHFLQTCSRLLTVETTSEGVQLEDHFVNVTYQPIGLNGLAIHETRQSKDVLGEINAFRNSWGDRKIIFARDMLDNIQGVRQKLQTFELFLKKYPEWQGRVTLVQVVTSISKSPELLAKISEICASIQSKYHELDNQPLLLLERDLTFEQHFALLSTADVLMISSLRDGLNLTAHEYVHCQDGAITTQKHGPLILSEFAGSASLFGDDALSINPWDYSKSALAIKTALEMADAEKERRWNRLRGVVETYTAQRWVKFLNKELDRVYEAQSQSAADNVPRLSDVQINGKYKEAGSRLFMIDYDGTLTTHATPTEAFVPPPFRVIDTINDLIKDKRNIVYVMSGRKPSELEMLFHAVPGLGLIAENGCFIRHYGAAAFKWERRVNIEAVDQWKQDVKTILMHNFGSLEHSVIDERMCSMFLRYDNVEDQEAAVRVAGDCADQINDTCRSLGIQAVPVHKALLIEPIDFSKGTAAKEIFDELCKKKAELASPSAPAPDDADGGQGLKETVGNTQAKSPKSGEKTEAAKTKTEDQAKENVEPQQAQEEDESKTRKDSAGETEPTKEGDEAKEKDHAATSTLDFLMVAGDDREDEAVFRWANALASAPEGERVNDVFTVSVGKRNTDAQATLTNGSSSLLSVLQKLANISMDEKSGQDAGTPSRRSPPLVSSQVWG